MVIVSGLSCFGNLPLWSKFKHWADTMLSCTLGQITMSTHPLLHSVHKPWPATALQSEAVCGTGSVRCGCLSGSSFVPPPPFCAIPSHILAESSPARTTHALPAYRLLQRLTCSSDPCSTLLFDTSSFSEEAPLV